MTNLRDYDRDAILIEKVRDLERQLADARESLDIAYAKGNAEGHAQERARIRKAILRVMLAAAPKPDKGNECE